VDENIASLQVKANATYLEQKRDLLHQGFFFGAALALMAVRLCVPTVTLGQP